MNTPRALGGSLLIGTASLSSLSVAVGGMTGSDCFVSCILFFISSRMNYHPPSPGDGMFWGFRSFGGHFISVLGPFVSPVWGFRMFGTCRRFPAHTPHLPQLDLRAEKNSRYIM